MAEDTITDEQRMEAYSLIVEISTKEHKASMELTRWGDTKARAIMLAQGIGVSEATIQEAVDLGVERA